MTNQEASGAPAGAAKTREAGAIGLPSLAASGSARLLFPNDGTFWYEISRSLATAEYGGAQMGEILAIAEDIEEGDFESWYVAFNGLADRISAEGRNQLAKGHGISARDGLLRASSYYFSSEFFLHGNPKDPRIARAYRRCVESYTQACGLFDVPIVPVEIPFEGNSLPGYWHRPDASGQRRPTLIIHTGFDGSAEEMHFTGARAAVERGYNVIAFDGPGQYGALHRDGLTFRPDWENVITPVVDFLLARPDVDPGRIVYMGMSLGGVLAPRAAAFEHRLAALVANDGLWDFGAALLGSLPPEERDGVREQVEVPDAPELDASLEKIVNGPSSGRWVFQHGLWAMGVATPREFMRKALAYHVRDGVAEKIICPTLVCRAEGDGFANDQGQTLYDQLTCPKTLMSFMNAEGAGAHCQVGAGRLAFARIFDWLDDLA